MKEIVVAIDGFSSTGKSTIAKRLGKKLRYVYIDSGAMYRAVTLYAIQNDLISDEGIDKANLIKQLDEIELKFLYSDTNGDVEMHLNDVNVAKAIRTMHVSQYVSQIASISEVRKKLVDQQQKMGKEKGVVMDGRDIGTVVFPDAEIKLFLTASADKRALRRYKELLDRGDEEITYERVLKNVESRDFIDSTREDSPLTQAEDAISIDNSDMGLEEQFERIYRLISDKIAELN